MQEKQDIHLYDKRLANLDKLLSPISKINRDLILKYKNYLFVRNLSKGRILKYMEVLKILANCIETSDSVSTKELEKLTKADLQYFIGIIQQKQYSPWTKQSYKVIVKRFISWLKNCEEGEVAEEVKWIKINFNKSEAKLPGEGDLISKEEVEKAMSVCNSLRDKTFLSTIYESGSRIGEIASLKISNVQFDKYGAQINIFGKTGSRRIRLVNSAFLLRIYLESHPQKDDKNAPLWYNAEYLGKPLYYGAFQKIIKMAFNKAGIKKRCNPHLFRHSRATEMASFLTEFQMNQYFGWKQGSDMPSTYVHMNGKEVDSAILSMNGIKEDSAMELKSKPVICKRCEFLNPSGTEFCLKCSLPLEEKAMIGLEERRIEKMKIDLVMNELIKQPEIQRILLDKIKELGLVNDIIR